MKKYTFITTTIICTALFAITFSASKALSETRKVPASKNNAVYPSQSATPKVQESDWSFHFAPYLWAAAISGDLRTEGVESEVSLGMGDAFSKGNGAVGVDFEGRTDGWGLSSQFLYTTLEDTSPKVEGPIFDRAHLTFQEFFFTQHISLTMVEGEYGFWDFLIGGRAANVSSDLKLRGGPEDRRRYSEDDTWVDPLVGYNLRLRLGEGVFFHTYGDIGGFDTASQLTWQALASLGFAVSDKASLAFGYRAISYDYEKDDFEYSVLMHGPTAKLDISF